MPSLAAGKVVLGFIVVAIVVAVVAESCNATSTAAARKRKDRSDILIDAVI